MRAEAQRLLAVGLLPIPAAGKVPSVCYKRGQWTRAIATRNLEKFDTCASLSILTDVDASPSLFVLDFDDEQARDYAAAKFPDAFASGPCVKTSKGYHYYWLHSALCNELNLTDATRLKAPMLDDERFACVDIKTRTAVWDEGLGDVGGYEASTISVPPSEGKTWVRSIYDVKPTVVPDELVRWLAGLKQ